MTKKSFALLVAMAVGCPALTYAQSVEGPGNEPCTKLEELLADPSRKIEITAWIQGFVTGINAVSLRTEDALEGMPMDEVLKRVQQVCKQNPNLAQKVEGKDQTTTLFHAVSAVVSMAVRHGLLEKHQAGKLAFIPPFADRFVHGLSGTERDGVLDAMEVLEEAQVQRAYDLDLKRGADGSIETFDPEFKKGYDFVDNATPKELLGIMRGVSVQRKLALSQRQKQKFSLTEAEAEKDSLLRMLAITQRNLTYIESLMDHGYYPKGHKNYEEQQKRRAAKKQ